MGVGWDCFQVLAASGIQEGNQKMLSHLEVGGENMRARISWMLRKESNTKTNLCKKSIGIGHHRGQKCGPSKRHRGEGGFPGGPVAKTLCF